MLLNLSWQQTEKINEVFKQSQRGVLKKKSYLTNLLEMTCVVMEGTGDKEELVDVLRFPEGF